MNVYPWQRAQWRRFLAMQVRERIPHALLLTGPRGVGLASFAERAAARLLCREPPAADVTCGACRGCVLFSAGNHPDFVLLTPGEKARQIKVDPVRELIDFMHLKSHYEGFKAAVIDPADSMNRSAANSLLKTLEEPPPTSLLILCSHNPGRLPVTIRSRCQRIDFFGAADAETVQWLETELPSGAPPAAELLELANGSPLLALELARTGAWEAREAVLDELVALRGRSTDAVTLAKKWSGFGADQVLEWLLGFTRRMARMRLPAVHGKHAQSTDARLQQLADELDLVRLVACHDLVMRNFLGATGPFNLNSQSLLEEVIVHWQASFDSGRRKTL